MKIESQVILTEEEIFEGVAIAVFRPIAYAAGRKAYHAGLPLDFGIYFFAKDSDGLTVWRRGWLDAQAIENAQNN